MESPQSQRSSHSESDDRGMSAQGQPAELLEDKGTRGWINKGMRGWINKQIWDICIKGDTDADSRSPSDVFIFRVPSTLKEQKKEAYYVPKIVSLGPYHHTSEKLAPMFRHKGRALHRMMIRSNTKHGSHLNILEFSDGAKKKIARLESKIRCIYEEHICCDGETLAMMLTLDGCFILEILRTVIGEELEEASKRYDPIFGRMKISPTGNDILCDILKLENQIPLIVLQDLLRFEFNSDESKHLAILEKALLSVFNPFNYDIRELWELQPHKQELQPVHLLGLLYRFIVSQSCHYDEDQIELGIKGCNTVYSIHHQEKDKLDKTGNDDTCHCTEDSRNPWSKFKCVKDSLTSPRAIELRNAGIHFKTCTGGIKQIKFESNSATIFLPPITISDGTEVLFRNLLAFEMCKPSVPNYIASYICFMDNLIDSDEDVALLRRKRIVTNRLGSDAEVAELFNGLCKGVVTDQVCDELVLQVNEHYYNSKIKREIKIQIAKLVEEHFSSPWKFLGLAGAIALLVLALLQTIYTMMPVHK